MQTERELTEREIQTIVDDYPSTPAPVIARRLGVSYAAVRRVVKRFRLRHNHEGRHACRQELRRRMSEPAAVAKRIAALQRRRAIEYRRVFEGRCQLTRLKLSMVPRRTRNAIGHLCRRHGYFRSVDDYTLIYDATTQRVTGCTRYNEQYYERKYKIKFAPDESLEPDDE